MTSTEDGVHGERRRDRDDQWSAGAQYRQCLFASVLRPASRWNEVAIMTSHEIPSHPHRTEYGAKDVVCGMTVDPHTAKHRHTHNGRPYYFCSARCREKFVANPAQLSGAANSGPPTCPGRHDLHLPDASRDPASRGRAPARFAAWRSSPSLSRRRRSPIPNSPT